VPGFNWTTIQTALPFALTSLTAIIAFFRFNGKTGRLQSQIKDSLELSKLALEAESPAAKAKADALVCSQLDRLQLLDSKAAVRKYGKATLGGAIALSMILGAASWLLLLPNWLPTNVLAWMLIAVICIIMPVGIVGFFTGDTRKTKPTTPNAREDGDQPSAPRLAA
jgi:Flp pilus assembly protein TadB